MDTRLPREKCKHLRTAIKEMLKLTIIVLFMALALSGAIGALGYLSCKQIPEQQSNTTKAEDTYEKYCSTFSKTFSVGLTEIGEFIHTYHDEINAFATVVIAIFTVILGFATAFLYIATRDLVKGAEKTAERQLRAYVSVDGAVIIHANDGWSPNFRIKIQNYGQTPAYEVSSRSAVTFVVIAGGAPNWEQLPKNPTHPSDLGPGQNHEETLIIHHDPWQIMKAEIEKKSGICYLFGEITYRDIFGADHYTRFRLEVGADDKGVSDGGLFFSRDGNYSN
jgi:hypothetical protein